MTEQAVRGRHDELGSAADAPFRLDALTAANVGRAAAGLGVAFRRRRFTPWATLWAWVAQSLTADGSCRAAMARLGGGSAAPGRPPGPSAYCKARSRLPLPLVRQLLREAGAEVADRAAAGWRWRGRAVKLVDGTTLQVPDRPALSRRYGKATGGGRGLTFPLMRMAGVFCLATGALLDLALGPYRGRGTGELALFRRLWGAFRAGDVVLGDRLYATFADVAGLSAPGVDVVVRMRASRPTDFRRGRRLGTADHVVGWRKPRDIPQGMTRAAFARLPAELAVREVRVRVATPGFRTRAVVLATTLLDPEAYPTGALADLYRERWQVELDMRSLKCGLGVGRLRCRSPEQAEKEAWVKAVAYNVIRGVQCRAARGAKGVTPRRLSVAATRQVLEAAGWGFGDAARASDAWVRSVVLASRVGDRPGRAEPRKLRSQRVSYPLLRRRRRSGRKVPAGDRLPS